MNGFCWQQVGLDRLNPTGPSAVRDRRSHAQHRPDPLGRRAGHRVHRSERHRRVGRLVRGGSDPDRRAPQQRHGLRGQDRRGRRGRRWLPLGRGRERNGRPDQRPRHLGRARLRQLRREPGRRGRVHAQRGRPPRRGEPARRRRHAHAGRRDRAVGGLAGGPRRAAKHAVFVSRLVGGDHFELFNSGQPVSNTENDATRPDITFSGNVPVHLLAGEGVRGAGDLRRTLRGWAPPRRSSSSTRRPASRTPDFGDVENPLRAPISSGCTANPTNADGATCQGGAIGTPFLLYTAGDDRHAEALRPGLRADRRVDARRDRHLRHGRDAERIGESGRRRHPDPLRLRCDDGLRHQHAGRSPRRRERPDRLRRDAERAHPGRDRPLQSRREDGLRHRRRSRPELRGREHAADRLDRRPPRQGDAERSSAGVGC